MADRGLFGGFEYARDTRGDQISFCTLGIIAVELVHEAGFCGLRAEMEGARGECCVLYRVPQQREPSERLLRGSSRRRV